MARVKKNKIVPYVLNWKPVEGRNLSYWEEGVYTVDDLLTLYEYMLPRYSIYTHSVDTLRQSINDLGVTGESYNDATNYSRHHHLRSLIRAAYPFTVAWERDHEAFFAEYDSRDDLKEIYTALAGKARWFRNRTGDYVEFNSERFQQEWLVRPESPEMFTCAVDNTYGKKYIEERKESPFMEGDLVLLRSAFVGDRRYDPMKKYGVDCPGTDVPRIGTILHISDKVAVARRGGVVGNRVVSVLWMGKEQPDDVYQRRLKFYERPTLANGRKKREG